MGNALNGQGVKVSSTPPPDVHPLKAVAKALESAVAIASGVVSLILLRFDPSPQTRSWLFWLAMILLIGIILINRPNLIQLPIRPDPAERSETRRPRWKAWSVIALLVTAIATIVSVWAIYTGPRDSISHSETAKEPWTLIDPPPLKASGSVGGQSIAQSPTLRIAGLGCPNSSSSLTFKNIDGNLDELNFRVGVSDSSPQDMFFSVQTIIDGVADEEHRIHRGGSAFFTSAIKGHETLSLDATALSHAASGCDRSKASLFVYDASLR